MADLANEGRRALALRSDAGRGPVTAPPPVWFHRGAAALSAPSSAPCSRRGVWVRPGGGPALGSAPLPAASPCPGPPPAGRAAGQRERPAGPPAAPREAAPVAASRRVPAPGSRTSCAQRPCPGAPAPLLGAAVRSLRVFAALPRLPRSLILPPAKGVIEAAGGR